MKTLLRALELYYGHSNFSLKQGGTVVVDENDKLADNQSFEWFSSGEQDQRMIQIPLGINYKFGKSKLNYFLG